MLFNVDRLQILSGIGNNDSGSGLLMESGNPFEEQKIRQIIREEIQAYLGERQLKSMASGFRKNNLTTAMGFAGPGFQPTPRENRSFARGPGRSFGFGGPGFM